MNNKFLRKWLPVFLWAAVIFTLSSVQQVTISQFFIWDFIVKKAAHVSEYAILYLLIFRSTGGNWLGSFILLMLYAVSDELHQSFVPGRRATIYDLGFDLTGANIAAYLLWKLKQIRQFKQKK